MQISRAAFDLIVSEEVSSEAAYRRLYQKPEWPQGASGVTVGIGYDLGQTPKAQILSDWRGRVPPGMLDYMASAAGVTGAAAKKLTAKLRDKIDIPWNVALAVHEQCVLPRWEDITRKALPNFDKLHPDCKGALVSLTFNRGASYSKKKTSADKQDRYREMRAIKAHMVAEEFDAIPSEFRASRRLWTTSANTGVRKRRETEARLFEKGLAAMRGSQPVGLFSPPEDLAPAPAVVEPLVDTQYPAEVPAAVQSSQPATAPAPVDKDVEGDPEIFSVQKRLKAMSYYTGVVNGKWGGMTSGAIGGFVNDRMFHLAVPTSPESFSEVVDYLKDELTSAESESPPFTRPVSEARANAAPELMAEVAPEIKPMKQSYVVQKWIAFTGFLSAIANGAQDYVAQAWAFYTGHKEDLPAPDTGVLSTVWSYLGKVPVTVWILLGASVIGALALRTRQGVKIAENAVKTGAR